MIDRDQYDTVKVESFKGINNEVSKNSVPTGELADAVNVDLDRNGKVFRRAGYVDIYTGSNTRCLTSFNGSLAFADGSALKRRDESGAVTTIHNKLNLSDNIAMIEVNGRLYHTDGESSLIADRDLSWTQWGIDPPGGGFHASGSNGGSLANTTYAVAVTKVSSDGEESGAPYTASADVPMNGKLQVSGMGGGKKNVYVSTGGAYHLEATTSGSSVSISKLEGGRVLAFEGKSRIPAGTLLAHHNGRIYVADGNILWYSEPYNYGLCDLRFNFFMFSDQLTMLGRGEFPGGMFVATTERTYWLRGGTPDAMNMLEILRYGAPRTVPVLVDGSVAGVEGKVEMWQSHKGLCIGGSDGSIINATDKKVAIPKSSGAAVAFRRDRGINQIISTSVKTANMGSGALRSEFTVE